MRLIAWFRRRRKERLRQQGFVRAVNLVEMTDELAAARVTIWRWRLALLRIAAVTSSSQCELCGRVDKLAINALGFKEHPACPSSTPK